MDRLSSLIHKTLRKHGMKNEADAAFVVHRAVEWLRKHGDIEGVTVMKLQDGVLVIEAETSVAAQECRSMTEELLAALRAEFPAITIKETRILRSRK